jgi:predicted AlkP superfamily phosphohydrolase/phosphomutase
MSTPIWSLLRQQNKHVGVINVPVTFPPEPVQGYMISGMYTPSEEADYTYPSTLKAELEQAIGGYSVFGRRSKRDLDLSLDGLFEAMEFRFRATDYLLSAKPWDLFVLVFQETDIVQHKFWKYMDPTHPDYVASAPAKYRSAILDIYRRMDDILARLLRHVDDDVFLILMSDHGAGPLCKYFYLNTWLLREGFLRLKPDLATRLRWLVFRSGAFPTQLLDLASRLSPVLEDKAVALVKREQHRTTDRKGLMQRLFLSNEDIDWSRTQAYALGGNFPGIYLNVRGREPEGCVSPAKEYDAVRDAICQRLLELRDPESSQSVVRAVHLREEIYKGPYAERTPDVLFDMNDEYMAFSMHEFSSNKVLARSSWFSGTHKPDGIVVISGPGIRQGVSLPSARIVDLMPTILYMLGCPIPRGLDGNVLESAFYRSHILDNSPSFSDADVNVEADGEAELDFSPEEVKIVEGRLRDLGYMG